MAIKKFAVDRDYVELHALLKLMDYAQSGGEAKAMVAEGLVRVDGEVETRKTRKLTPGCRVAIGADLIDVIKA